MLSFIFLLLTKSIALSYSVFDKNNLSLFFDNNWIYIGLLSIAVFSIYHCMKIASSLMLASVIATGVLTIRINYQNINKYNLICLMMYFIVSYFFYYFLVDELEKPLFNPKIKKTDIDKKMSQEILMQIEGETVGYLSNWGEDSVFVYTENETKSYSRWASGKITFWGQEYNFLIKECTSIKGAGIGLKVKDFTRTKNYNEFFSTLKSIGYNPELIR